jgi:hypothetical protein
MSNIIKMIESKKIRLSGPETHTEELRNAYRVLVGKPEGKRLLGRLRRR